MINRALLGVVPTRSPSDEPMLDRLMAEPIVQQLMRRDRLERLPALQRVSELSMADPERPLNNSDLIRRLVFGWVGVVWAVAIGVFLLVFRKPLTDEQVAPQWPANLWMIATLVGIWLLIVVKQVSEGAGEDHASEGGIMIGRELRSVGHDTAAPDVDASPLAASAWLSSAEPTLDQLLAEPIVQQLMRRDQTDEPTIRHLLRETAAARPAMPAKNDPPNAL
jgi:hypothetical protein